MEEISDGVATRAEGRSTRRRLSAEDRRAGILDAALEVFSRRGYHGAAIDEIAQTAGISKALIYEHFPSKRDLHASLLARHVDEVLELLQRSAATSEPAEVRLRAAVDAFLGWVESHRDGFRMLFRDVFERDVAAVLMQLQRQMTAAVAAMIEPDARRGAAAQADDLAIEAFAQLLSGSVQAAALWWQDHPNVSREFVVDRVLDFAWTGLERQRAAESRARGNRRRG